MTPMARRYYSLEKLWRKGEMVDLSSIIRPNLPEGVTRGGKGDSFDEEEEEEPPSSPTTEAAQEDDPFWS